MSRHYNFVFTHNNYPNTELEDTVECQYIIYGKEIAPTTGTPHLQGFIRFSPWCSLKQAKKRMPGCWIEPALTLEAAMNYCTKDSIVTERGTKPVTQDEKGTGEKERYKRAREAAIRGDMESIDSDIYIRHYGNLKKIRAEHQVQPAQLGELNNLWLYGPPGSGKTSRAFSENPGAYLKGLNKWWDGYTDQACVIIDDMDPYHKSLAQEFKAWAHHMPFPAETKGGSTCIRPQKIIVTSNYSIDSVWEDSITREAMHRRFTEVYIGTPAHPDPVAYIP